jgi:hypothetical protein
MGEIHCGVRWKTWTDRAVSASFGMTWTPVEPLPITAIRAPAGANDRSQRALWKIFPPNVSTPAMSGVFGWLNSPAALISALAWSVLSRPEESRRWSVHVCAASSNVARRASVPNRILSATPNSCATCSR